MSDTPGIGGETFTITFTGDSFCREEIYKNPVKFEVNSVILYLSHQMIKNTNLIKRLRNATSKNK